MERYEIASDLRALAANLVSGNAKIRENCHSQCAGTGLESATRILVLIPHCGKLRSSRGRIHRCEGCYLRQYLREFTFSQLDSTQPKILLTVVGFHPMKPVAGWIGLILPSSFCHQGAGHPLRRLLFMQCSPFILSNLSRPARTGWPSLLEH